MRGRDVKFNVRSLTAVNSTFLNCSILIGQLKNKPSKRCRPACAKVMGSILIGIDFFSQIFISFTSFHTHLFFLVGREHSVKVFKIHDSIYLQKNNNIIFVQKKVSYNEIKSFAAFTSFFVVAQL